MMLRVDGDVATEMGVWIVWILESHLVTLNQIE